MITHPEFLIERKKCTDDKKKKAYGQLEGGFVTRDSLQELWGDDAEFLTDIMLNFELFIPMAESEDTNLQYMIPCMLPVDNDDHKVCLYDAEQESHCGDWFQVGAFDKLVAAIGKYGWTISSYPRPTYAQVSFEHGNYLTLRLSLMQNPKFRVSMYCLKTVIKEPVKFTKTVGLLQKTIRFIRERTKQINIKGPKDFKVLCPYYGLESQGLQMILAQEGKGDEIRTSDLKCPCHNKVLPTSQYTWFLENIICRFNCYVPKLAIITFQSCTFHSLN